MIKLPVTVASSGIFIDAEKKWVQSEAIAAALNAAPKRAFGELSGALWGIYKAAADAAEAIAGDPGGFATAADWDYYERRIVDELEERLQAFAAPQVQQWQPIEVDLRKRIDWLSDEDMIDLLYRMIDARNVSFGNGEDAEEAVAAAGRAALLDLLAPLPAAPEAQGGWNG